FLIRPALAAGKWVICDRFADSTRVYQGVSGNLPAEVVLTLEHHVVGATHPDLTLILDAPVSLAFERRAARAGLADVFEQRGDGFHESVRQAFAEIARREPERCRIVDASRAAPEVAAMAWLHVSQLLAEAAS
ncbi:MAG: thymidylate kinase, partial [Hyphomonas sp.]|uniref:dTMP kinase n=1 Tax=Hyphomonas sp. TaxID=87 RepID=UPI0034A06B7F